MPRDSKGYLEDILASAAKVRSYVGSMTREHEVRPDGNAAANMGGQSLRSGKNRRTTARLLARAFTQS